MQALRPPRLGPPHPPLAHAVIRRARPLHPRQSQKLLRVPPPPRELPIVQKTSSHHHINNRNRNRSRNRIKRECRPPRPRPQQRVIREGRTKEPVAAEVTRRALRQPRQRTRAIDLRAIAPALLHVHQRRPHPHRKKKSPIKQSVAPPRLRVRQRHSIIIIISTTIIMIIPDPPHRPTLHMGPRKGFS